MAIEESIDPNYIKKLKTRERQLRFILDLKKKNDACVELNSLVNNITKSTMEYLEADGCNYNIIQEDRISVNHSIYNKLPMPQGDYKLSNYPKLKQLLEEGQVFSIENIIKTNKFDEHLKDSLVGNRIVSCLVTPIKKDNKVLGFFSITQSSPRVWTQDQYNLIKEIAVLAWSSAQIIQNDREKEELIFQLKEKEENLLKLIEELRRIDSLKKSFLASLCHELRNPLATISLGLDLMEHAEGDIEVQRETRKSLQRQSKQLNRLVDDLWNMTKINHNKFELVQEKIILNQLLKDLGKDFYFCLANKGIKFETDISSEKIIILGDKYRLTQVLENILNNSSKFTPKGGKVSLRLKRSRDKNIALISIKDTGKGIAADKLEEIFEPYVQAKDFHERKYGGLGLGLSIVKDIVEKHQGTIQALSQGQDKGTEMIIELPIL